MFHGSEQNKYKNANKFLRKKSLSNLNCTRKWERYLSAKNKIQYQFSKDKSAWYSLENLSLKPQGSAAVSKNKYKDLFCKRPN